MEPATNHYLFPNLSDSRVPTRVPFRKLPKVEVLFAEAEKPATPQLKEALRLPGLSILHTMSNAQKKSGVQSAMVRIAASCPLEAKEAWLNPSRFGKSIRPEFLFSEFGKRFDSAIREGVFIHDETDRGRMVDAKIVALFWLLKKPWRNATGQELSEVTGLTLDQVQARLVRIREEDKTFPRCNYSPTAATIDRLAQIAIDNEGTLPPPSVLSRMLDVAPQGLYPQVKVLQECGIVKAWERQFQKKPKKGRNHSNPDTGQKTQVSAEEAA